MASIKLDSKIVIEACDIATKKYSHVLNEIKMSTSDQEVCKYQIDRLRSIKQLAEYAKSYGGEIHLDQQDFFLIGAYLPKPTTYHKD